MGAPRTRPLHPASPAHCRSGLREERADHRERAAWGSRGGRARAAPSFPLPSALGPRGPRRSEKMALHFQVSAPAAGLELRRWRAARGVGGSQAATPSEHSPLPGDGELAAGCARPPESALVGVGCSDVRAGGSGSGGAARQPPHPARGRRPPGEPGLRGRGGGSAGARLEDCHWPEAGGRVGARRGRERAASLEEPRGRARAALEGCICLVAQALSGSSSHRRLRSLPTGVRWRNVLGLQGNISYHPYPFRARGNYCTRENCYGRISHGISRGHRKRAGNRVCRVEPPLVTWFLLLAHMSLSKLQGTRGLSEL